MVAIGLLAEMSNAIGSPIVPYVPQLVEVSPLLHAIYTIVD